MIVNPLAENLSSAISISTVTSCPWASLEQQARKWRTMNSYSRFSFPFKKRKIIKHCHCASWYQLRWSKQGGCSPVNCWCIWWGEWGDGPDQICFHFEVWAHRFPKCAEQNFPIHCLVSVAQPAWLDSGSVETCWSQYEDNWWTWKETDRLICEGTRHDVDHRHVDEITFNIPLSIQLFCDFHGFFGTYPQFSWSQFFKFLEKEIKTH